MTDQYLHTLQDFNTLQEFHTLQDLHLNLQGFPLPRGPVCYSCHSPTSDGRCHDIDHCEQGEVCIASLCELYYVMFNQI